MTSRLVLPLLLMLAMTTAMLMHVAAVQRGTTNAGDSEHSTTHRRERSVGNHATGVDGGETEPRGTHLVSRLRRRPQWKPKPTTRARPEGVAGRDSRRSSETGTTSNGDHAFRRRFRRDVYGLYGPRPRPRPTRSGPASTRIPPDVDQLRRLRAMSIDDLPPSRRPKRPEPESDSPTIEQLSNIIRNLLDVVDVGGGGSWSCAIEDRNDPLDRRKSWIASDEIFVDKKASQRRRKANSADPAEQLHRNALKMRHHRPQIDPMLMMVGIGRK